MKDEKVIKRFLFYLCTKNEIKIVRYLKERFGEENVDTTLNYNNQRNKYYNYFDMYSNNLLSEYIERHESFRSNEPIYQRFYKIYQQDKSLCMKFVKFICFQAKKHMYYKSEVDEHVYGYFYYSGTVIYIRYPELSVVQNENEAIRTTVYDYFQVVESVFGCICSPTFSRNIHQIGLSGIKTTFTPEQYNSHYVHSHLRKFEGTNAVTISAMCVGENSPIKTEAFNIESYMRKSNVFDLPMSFIYIMTEHLNTVVQVESIQGVPWAHISNISPVGSRSNLYLDKHNTCSSIENVPQDDIIKNKLRDSVIKMFEINNKLHLISFSVINGTVCYSNNNIDLVLQLNNLFSKTESAKDYAFCIKDNCVLDNNVFYYITGSTSTQRLPREDEYYVLFKNKEYDFKLTESKSEYTTLKIITDITLFSVIYNEFLKINRDYIKHGIKRKREKQDSLPF